MQHTLRYKFRQPRCLGMSLSTSQCQPLCAFPQTEAEAEPWHGDFLQPTGPGSGCDGARFGCRGRSPVLVPAADVPISGTLWNLARHYPQPQISIALIELPRLGYCGFVCTAIGYAQALLSYVFGYPSLRCTTLLGREV